MFEEMLNDMIGFRTTACEEVGYNMARMYMPDPIENFEALCKSAGLDPKTLTEEEKQIILDTYLKNK